MDEGVRDMRGQTITVGCKVSDGLCGGTVVSVSEKQVWFLPEGGFGNYGKLRGKLFNHPLNLMVIPDRYWKNAFK